jgi:hypothetical protein
VGISPNAGVGIGVKLGLSRAVGDLVGKDHPGEMLDVDLVHDPGARRNDLEIIESGLTPAQELITLVVAAVFDLDVPSECIGCTEDISDHGVIDYQLCWRERVDLGRVATHICHCLTHRGQIDYTWHTREVLHDHSGRCELNLFAGLGVRIPARQCPNVIGGDIGAVFGAEQVLQQDLEAVRQRIGSLHGVQPEDLVRVLAHLEGCLCIEAVHTHEPLHQSEQTILTSR